MSVFAIWLIGFLPVVGLGAAAVDVTAVPIVNTAARVNAITFFSTFFMLFSLLSPFIKNILHGKKDAMQ